MALLQHLESPDPIAIIGIGCRHLGEVDPSAAFWNLICNRVDSVAKQLKPHCSDIVYFPFDLLEVFRAELLKITAMLSGLYATENVLLDTDGDLAPLPKFVRVNIEHNASLLVREAEFLGVLRVCRRGICEHFKISVHTIDGWVRTLSKFFVSAAVVLKAFRIFAVEPDRVVQVQGRSPLSLSLVREHGLNVGNSNDSLAISIIVGRAYKVVQLSHALFQQSITVQPMLYSFGPCSAGRLCVFLSCLHTEEHLRTTEQIVADELMTLNAAALP